MTINDLKSRIYVDELNAIRLPGFADGMLEGYKDAEKHPDKIKQHSDGVHYRYVLFLDDPHHTDFEANFRLGMLAAYRRAENLYNEKSRSAGTPRPLNKKGV
jgi:hypothetical protein